MSLRSPWVKVALGSRVTGICGVPMGQGSWWWFGGHGSSQCHHPIPSSPIPSHSIPGLVFIASPTEAGCCLSTASPTEAGHNPAHPWPWGLATGPTAFRRGTLSLGSASPAARSSHHRSAPQVGTSGPQGPDPPAWHLAGPMAGLHWPHAGGGGGALGIPLGGFP